ncbi:unnamed protein product [Leptidea sinapis]|uniref:Sushi domain-containing protein n=1 Tax=Leptidea sinapis TaxID=189913 RepID=A0A5E4QF10_9NEOP|nr:unnamed protein product [Leptidea sinapis]
MDMEQFLENFAKVKEIKFPISYGPVTEKYICKLKCVDGYWVGPLCSSSTDGRFKTLLKECVYKHEYPLLTVYFRNSSIQNDTNFPHNTTISARCKYFGMYKLKGDSEIRCENGAWLSKFPECVPTTVITNFTGDAPPTIRYEVLDGSAIVEPNGELLVFPDSHIRIDCMALRSKGDPEWTWTQSWLDDYSNTFRINLPKLGVRFAETFTCSTPDGTTNKIVVRVVSHWSSPPPICEETFCPFFTSLNPQLSIIEHNSSFGGRAVFTCAWGYRLVGAPGLECEQDGQWSGEMPQCIPIYCPDPILPEHGQLVTKTISKDGKFPVGDLLIYACNEGYEVMGELSIVCTENGFWSHPPPFCLPPTEIKRLNTIYLENTTLVNLDSVY